MFWPSIVCMRTVNQSWDNDVDGGPAINQHLVGALCCQALLAKSVELVITQRSCPADTIETLNLNNDAALSQK